MNRLSNSVRVAAFAATLLGGTAVAQSIPCYDTNLGQPLGLADDGGVNMLLGFTFPFAGQNHTSIDICSNGYLWFGAPGLNPWDYSPSIAEFLSLPPRIAPLWDDFDPTAAGSDDVYFNTYPASPGVPARAVITWHQLLEYGRNVPITVQCQMLDDGRVFFFYDPSIATVTGGTVNSLMIVGTTAGNAATANAVNWSNAPISTSGNPTAYESFTAGQFDLIGRGLELLPDGQGGWIALPRSQCILGTFQKFGNGCPHGLSFYELFGAGAVDLANTSIQLNPAAGGYAAVAGPGLDPSYSTIQPMLDDQVINFPLGFSFPFASGAVTSVDVSSNGFFWMAPNGAALPAPSILDLLNQGGCIAGLWSDMDPSVGGQVYFDANATRAMVTWVAVPQWNTPGSANTFQILLRPSGVIVLSYGAVSLPTYGTVVGLSEGGGAADPGTMDISASMPFSVGAPGALAVTLDAATGSRPSIGGTFTLNVSNVPPGSGLAALLLGFGVVNVNLQPLGMSTCRQYLNTVGGTNLLRPVAGSTVGFPLTLPGNSSLLGLVVEAQGATFSPGVNPFGIAASNGGRLTVGL